MQKEATNNASLIYQSVIFYTASNCTGTMPCGTDLEVALSQKDFGHPFILLQWRDISTSLPCQRVNSISCSN